MKVYFSGSRYFLSEFDAIYKTITNTIAEEGFSVMDMTSFFINDKVGVSEKQKLDSYGHFLKSLNICDISVFEASYPSTVHLGHEITLAIQKGRPVIILHKDDPKHEPLVLKGMESDKVIWLAYTDKNMKEKLIAALDTAKKMQDVRFNFFVSPKILEYLDFVAKKRMIPRSVFLRDLIEKEMKKDKLFETNE